MGKGCGESTFSTQHAQYQSALDIAAHIKTVEEGRPADGCTYPAPEGKMADIFLFNPDSPTGLEVETQFALDTSSFHTLGDLADFRCDYPSLNLEDVVTCAVEAFPDTWVPQPVASAGSPILGDPLLHNILFNSEPASQATPFFPTTPDAEAEAPLLSFLGQPTPFATPDLAPFTAEPAVGPAPVPQALASQEEVVQHLAAIPSSIATEDGTQVTFSPTLWRRPQHPHGAMLNVRVTTLAGVRPDQQTTTFYGAISPRIITTGYCPYARPAAAAAPAHHTRRTLRGSHSADLPSAGSGGLARHPSASPRSSSATFTLEEMWLLKRAPAQPQEVADSYHFDGPFESSFVPNIPAWPGAWKIDLVARLVNCEGGSFWVKALHREIAAYDDT